MLTEPANVNVPKAQLARIREQVPETQAMSPSRVLRYALARTIGLSHDEAIRASDDPRKGVKRGPREPAR